MLSAQESSRWRSQAGGVFTLEDDDGRVVIRFEESRDGAQRQAMKPGTIVFRGQRKGQGIAGRSSVRAANGCDVVYPMEIAVHDDKLILKADMPTGVDRFCRAVKKTPRTFTWTRMPPPVVEDVPPPDDARVAAMKLDCRYNPGIFGNPLAPPPIAIAARGSVSEWRDFADGAEAQRFLERVLSYARPHCRAERTRRGIRGQVHDILHVTVASPRGTVLDARHSGGNWTVSNNAPRWAEDDRRREAERKEREARLAEEARAKAEAAAKRLRNRQTFASTHRVVAFMNVGTLKTNPFPYRDKVVGVYASFSQMLSEREALFGDLLVTGLPATEFKVSGAEVVLAARVVGLKQTRLPMGFEVPLPQVSYLGVFRCKEPRCTDFFDP
jgi:hypothetical protein